MIMINAKYSHENKHKQKDKFQSGSYKQEVVHEPPMMSKACIGRDTLG